MERWARLRGPDQRFYTVQECPMCQIYGLCLMDHPEKPLSYWDIKDQLEYKNKIREPKEND